jgi:hypothetical protein
LQYLSYRWFALVSVAVAACVIFGASAHASRVGLSSFRADSTVERFEGLEEGPNVRRDPNSAAWVPGIADPYGFTSGITLVHPIPNAGSWNHSGLLVPDWRLGNAGWSVGIGNPVRIVDVPSGTAFVGLQYAGAPIPYADFSFPTPAL